MIKVKNKHNGVESSFTDEQWERAKKKFDVNNVFEIISKEPVPKPKEVLELEEKKEEIVKTKNNSKNK